MITNEMLLTASAKASACILKNLPDPSECQHTFSQKFERKISRLIHRNNHPILYGALRFAACLILVITIGFGSFLAISPDARAKAIKWIRTQYRSFYQYIFNDEPTKESTWKYGLSAPPAGYELISSQAIPGGEIYIYANNSGHILQFSYTSNLDSSSLFIGNSDSVQKTVIVNNIRRDLYISNNPNDSNGIVWADDESGTLFFISGLFLEDELISLAEKVTSK